MVKNLIDQMKAWEAAIVHIRGTPEKQLGSSLIQAPKNTSKKIVTVKDGEGFMEAVEHQTTLVPYAGIKDKAQESVSTKRVME